MNKLDTVHAQLKFPLTSASLLNLVKASAYLREVENEALILCVAVATMTKCVPMEHAFVQEVFITPLGPKSDQHQFSPNNIGDYQE